MFVIIGYIIVCACVVGGYALAGGKLKVLWQPLEVLIICGSAFGAFMVANTAQSLKATFAAIPSVLKGSPHTKARYMDIMALLFDILSKARREGLMSIEQDVEEPDKSAIFGKYPAIVADHHLTEFITDYLRMMVSGNLNAIEIENLMDVEMETHHHEALGPAHAIQSVGDGLPAFGIVAAVLGVVKTMGSVGAPPAILGDMIAMALVGTFLGILMAYGFVSPLVAAMTHRVEEAGKEYQCVKTVLLASMQGYAPAICVEFGRKVLFPVARPGFAELEAHVKQKKA